MDSTSRPRTRAPNTDVTGVTGQPARTGYLLVRAEDSRVAGMALRLLLFRSAETLPDNGKPVVRRGRKAAGQADA